MQRSTAVQEWLRVHKTLLEKETAFSELALRAASGELSLDVLDQERRALMSLRTHCTSVYEAAFSRTVTP